MYIVVQFHPKAPCRRDAGSSFLAEINTASLMRIENEFQFSVICSSRKVPKGHKASLKIKLNLRKFWLVQNFKGMLRD